ncbi:MAG TPA: hypothetical protein ENK73_05975 [Thiomicrospira sp.]|nr:hypothetical protein [Thiomicrospira sp.]
MTEENPTPNLSKHKHRINEQVIDKKCPSKAEVERMKGILEASIQSGKTPRELADEVFCDMFGGPL